MAQNIAYKDIKIGDKASVSKTVSEHNQNQKKLKKFFSGMKKARTKHIVCTSF